MTLDRVLSDCGVGNGATLYAQWVVGEGKDERRKRYGRGGERKGGVEGRGGQKGGRKERDGRGKRGVSGAGETKTRSASEAGGDEQNASACVLGDRRVDDMNIEPEGDLAGVGGEGAQGLGWEVVEEGQNAPREEEEVEAERPMEEGDEDDQLEDNDSDKENRAPLLIPIVQVRVDDDREEEWLGFDESNGGVGVDLREEVLEF